MSDQQLPVFTIEELEKLSSVEFEKFDNDDAVDLGLVAVAVIREHDRNLAVKVSIHGETAFRANLKNTGAANDQWLAGKEAVVHHYGESSLLAKLRLAEAGRTLEDEGLDAARHKLYGGSVPIRVAGQIVGTISMSGEPDVLDHGTVVEAIERYLAR
jgi:uncharacterized protein (UPF0303 family)